ncbi:ABC1 family protein [hydrothermal vent metagenome]|uniref:ABC1 family protein n=1 Tax=hydrothermal vent metagenome TaxID=652676 RepID=A0A3B0Z054_9ZZZZ
MGIFRFFRISFSLWGYAGWLLLVRLRLLRHAESPAQRLVRVIERLGTTFIKLGQGIGLRRDLLPDEYVDALEGLQDRVAPFPGEIAVREVTAALGAPPTELFADFEKEPMASASIAQVHRAHLKDGTEVVVKVRRPDIKRQVAQDIWLLRTAVRGVLLLLPFLRRYRPLDILAEAHEVLQQEMDFCQEARSMQRFREAFKDWDTVNIPAVFEAFSTESVLVQECSHGRRVDDPTIGADGPRLAKNFVDAYLHQFFILGLFHGDPHPGNLFVMDDGRICFHDFGLVGFMDRETRRNLAAFMQAFVRQDADWLLDAYLDLGVLASDLDEVTYRAGLEKLLDDYARLPLKDWSFAVAFARIIRMGQGRDVRFPRNLLILMRTLFLMETTVRSLDPDFNLLDGLAGQAEPIAKAAMKERAETGKVRLGYEAGIALQDLPNSVGKWLRRVRKQGLEIRLQHHGLRDLERHLDRSSNRLALALVTLGLYIASALLMQVESTVYLWGMPLPAVIGFALALWFTLRLAASISRSGRL